MDLDIEIDPLGLLLFGVFVSSILLFVVAISGCTLSVDEINVNQSENNSTGNVTPPALPQEPVDTSKMNNYNMDYWNERLKNSN